MNGHPWLPSADPSREPAAGLEMLQTDVMRFFAILALCLMVIFALVQSIPSTTANSSPELQSRELLAREIEALEARVASLRAASEALQRNVADAQRRLAETERKTGDEAARLDALALQVQALQVQADEQREKLARVRSESAHARRSLTDLQADLEALRAAVGAAEARLEEHGRALASTHPSAQATSATATPSAAETDTGLELRFESERVLRDLIAAGTVGFYAQAAGQIWRLRADAGSVRFTLSAAPAELYEMTPGTVPAEFVVALQSRVAQFDRNTIVWGVTLPPSARRAITKGSRDHRAGTLVIGPAAEILHRGQ